MRAKIVWLPASVGGRHTPLNSERYACAVRFANFDAHEYWSFVVEFDKIVGPGEVVGAAVRFLTETAPQSTLKKGNQFTLCEGARIVAVGEIE